MVIVVVGEIQPLRMRMLWFGWHDPAEDELLWCDVQCCSIFKFESNVPFIFHNNFLMLVMGSTYGNLDRYIPNNTWCLSVLVISNYYNKGDTY